MILAALLFGMLLRGGIFVDVFTEHVTKDLVQVLQAIIILFVAAEALFRGPFARYGLLKASRVLSDDLHRSRCSSRPSGWRRRCCWRRSAGCSPSARASSTSRSKA